MDGRLFYRQIEKQSLLSMFEPEIAPLMPRSYRPEWPDQTVTGAQEVGHRSTRAQTLWSQRRMVALAQAAVESGVFQQVHIANSRFGL
jgi:hypothetical protein